MVPTGTSIKRSFPLAPLLLLLKPFFPDSAEKYFSNLNLAKVFKLALDLSTMLPPEPPSPPSGPPLGRFLALLKLKQPSPPSPAETSTCTSSMKFIEPF